MFTPLDQPYQTVMYGPNHPYMVRAIAAAGLVLENNNRAGWQTIDESIVQTIIDDEAQWLPFAKADKLDQLTQRYQSVVAAGRTISGKTFQIDDASFDKLQAFWNNNVWPISWITIDNSTVSLSQAQFQAGTQNVMQYLSAVKLNANAIKNAIRAAGSKAALDVIDVAGGWPSNP